MLTITWKLNETGHPMAQWADRENRKEQKLSPGQVHSYRVKSSHTGRRSA